MMKEVRAIKINGVYYVLWNKEKEKELARNLVIDAVNAVVIGIYAYRCTKVANTIKKIFR